MVYNIFWKNPIWQAKSELALRKIRNFTPLVNFLIRETKCLFLRRCKGQQILGICQPRHSAVSLFLTFTCLDNKNSSIKHKIDLPNVTQTLFISNICDHIGVDLWRRKKNDIEKLIFEAFKRPQNGLNSKSKYEHTLKNVQI